MSWNWYLQIPEALKVLTPRIISYKKQGGKLHIVQEYYGYSSLAELYVYGDLHAETWFSILRHVLRIHDAFREHKATLTRADQELMLPGQDPATVRSALPPGSALGNPPGAGYHRQRRAPAEFPFPAIRAGKTGYTP